ncbi:MAG TPA: MerR family transcriptional regulator [Streptosporangiaceae bacterium]|nr:MerR family transcriptional regulator [Streptosporangiaceae bacterium]
MGDDAWTIGELAELAGAALAGDPVQVSGRVRELPNERLIRWYTTIGLLDPPVARRGRTALYGPRHLLQLVAVKRRQAAGLAIAEIQAELAGATDGMLRELARLPETVTSGAIGALGALPISEAAAEADAGEGARDAEATEAREGAETPGAERRERRRRSRGRFWAGAPAAEGAVTHPLPEPAVSGIAGAAASAPTVVPGIRLADGVTLLLDGGPRPIAAADLVAIDAAARPLLDELRRRGLLPEHPEPGPGPAIPSGPESAEPILPTSPGRRST